MAYRRKLQLNRRNVLFLLGALLLVVAVSATWRANRQDIKIWNWTLGDKTIVIDAGHGGVDPGAVGVTQVLEKDVTLAVAKRVQALITQGGGRAVMVREEDQDLGISQNLLTRKREDLAQRLQLAIDVNADIYLCIHANSFPNPKLSGAQVFYRSESAAGKILAQTLQQSLNNAIAGTRVAKPNKDFFILKKANSAAVTVEMGFLSNPTEERQLKDPAYQQKLAVAIYQGLYEYFSKSQNIKQTVPPAK